MMQMLAAVRAGSAWAGDEGGWRRGSAARAVGRQLPRSQLRPKAARPPSRTTTRVHSILPRDLAPNDSLDLRLPSMNSTEPAIALNWSRRWGPVRCAIARSIRHRNGFLSARKRELRSSTASATKSRSKITNWESAVDLSEELERIRDFGADVITAQSPMYRASFREIHAAADRPLCLGRTDGA